MECQDILKLMGTLKLYGMRTAFDEIIANGVKRQHPVEHILADLLKAEIDEKQARSIKYQMTNAKLPIAKDLAQFEFEGSPVNEALVRDLATGGFLAQQRNAVLVGGASSKTRPPISRNAIFAPSSLKSSSASRRSSSPARKTRSRKRSQAIIPRTSPPPQDRFAVLVSAPKRSV